MSDTLGYYSRGQLFPQLVVSNIDGSIQSVMLPALSSHQDNQKRVKEMMRRAVVSSSFIVFPMMIGMAAVAEPLVRIVLTDKWLPAVPFMQIFCFLLIVLCIKYHQIYQSSDQIQNQDKRRQKNNQNFLFMKRFIFHNKNPHKNFHNNI